MKERPILFSGPMVRAILEGRKSQTRRVCKGSRELSRAADWPLETCPYGQPGDRLWVRETWRHTADNLEEARALTEDALSGIAVDWRATYIDCCIRELGFSLEAAKVADDFETWRPSIHMPRWASRITLEVTDVRVERLQEITETDAKAEGVCQTGIETGAVLESGAPVEVGSFAASYCDLWEQINGPGSWAANPWVWVIEFRRLPQ